MSVPPFHNIARGRGIRWAMRGPARFRARARLAPGHSLQPSD